MDESPKVPIIFFDGVCNLCNGFVDALVRFKSPKANFKIASLQGEAAKKWIPTELRERPAAQASVVLRTAKGELLTSFEAIYRIANFFQFPLNYLSIFLLWPLRCLCLGELAYQWVAKHRYRLFGKRTSCRLPSPDEQSFFLP